MEDVKQVDWLTDWVLAPVTDNPDRRLTPAERAADFHRNNPHVLEAVRKVALQMRRAGHAQWSVNGAFEVLRYQWAMQTHDPEGFKLNNTYRAWYARELMRTTPELADFFETRGDND